MADHQQQIPVEVIFNPNWWNRNYGISFGMPFYFNKEMRIENNLLMRSAMYERFGFGEFYPRSFPVIGSLHVSGGFVLPALYGVKFRFSENEAPIPLPRNLSQEEVFALKAPDFETTWPMDVLITDMDSLEEEYGFVVGDFNIEGILDTAVHLRGNQLFNDFTKDPDLVHYLFSILTETTVALASYLKRRTGTYSIANNRSILNVDPQMFLHSNCSVQMITPGIYEKYLLPYELQLSEQLHPYGIHHCGNNLELYSTVYSKVPAVFFDVGWGSDVTRCRQVFQKAFLNLHLSPVDMLQKKPEEIRDITTHLLTAGFFPGKTGVCCMNMDYGTPDENVMAMVEAVKNYSSNQAI